jgi:hypothetical protein
MATDSINWTVPYIAYLDHQVLPQDEKEARMIQRRCKSFVMINNELYKHNISGVFQRCVSSEEGHKILYDIHAGDYGHHAEHVCLSPRQCAMASTGSQPTNTSQTYL